MSHGRKRRLSSHSEKTIISRENDDDALDVIWAGKSHASSDFVVHFSVDDNNSSNNNRDTINDNGSSSSSSSVKSGRLPTVSQAIASVLPKSSVNSPHKLLQLGSVWYATKQNDVDSIRSVEADHDVHGDDGKSSPVKRRKLQPDHNSKDPKSRPIRLSLEDEHWILSKGDYLRIHHSPRRYSVDQYDWASFYKDDGEDDDKTSGVIVSQRDGFLVINKPANVPVHATVDNSIENVASMLQQNLKLEYTTAPQRLDQNTCGLMVIATSSKFASYFAQLLRGKTDQVLDESSSSASDHLSTMDRPTSSIDGNNDEDSQQKAGIRKRYKCLVCIILDENGEGSHGSHDGAPNNRYPSSMADAMQRLKSFEIIRHYLEPSPYSPKNFQREIPSDDDEDGVGGGTNPAMTAPSWAECLLRIVSIADDGPIPLRGSDVAESLAEALWSSSGHGSMPKNCVGVVEVQVELLTGRTHQIRGQMAAEGFPLVGDVLYGGAIQDSISKTNTTSTKSFFDSPHLALQCCSLKFLDPDVVMLKDGAESWEPSERWNSYELRSSWWTPMVKQYRKDAAVPCSGSTTSMEDLIRASSMGQNREKTERSVSSETCLLPPRVSLSPGRNKYVLVKATRKLDVKEDTGEFGKEDETFWFVKSASPSECGGPYHADVAKDLVEWLDALGEYEVEVTGGGRIEYDEDKKRAIVYGFSYGFGRGDHVKVAALISHEMRDVVATLDLSGNRY